MHWSVGSVPTAARGLRVLLVDCNIEILLYMAALLQLNDYKVTMTEVAAEAMTLIVELKNQYDIIIAEVNMPKIDGFIFLEHIIRQVDNIPIILMSEDPDGKLARRALENGASFFFKKPISSRHIINVWQHYYRVKRFPNIQTQNPSDKKGTKIKMITEKSSKTLNHKHVQEAKEQDNSLQINPGGRMKWTPELHLKFLNALAQIGENKPNPKTVTEIMDVPYLKVRHVASHLQKYRDKLKQLDSSLDDISALQTKSPFNLDGLANKYMHPQTRGKSVHLTIDTLREQMDFIKFNPKNTRQDKGMGEQPMYPELQRGNFYGLTASCNVDQAMNVVPPGATNSEKIDAKRELDEVMNMLEEDNYEELGQKFIIDQNIEMEWGQLLTPFCQNIEMEWGQLLTPFCQDIEMEWVNCSPHSDDLSGDSGSDLE